MTDPDDFDPAGWERIEALWRVVYPLHNGKGEALDALPADTASLRPELESLLSCATDAEAFFRRFAGAVEDAASALTTDASVEGDVAAALRAMPLAAHEVMDPLVGQMLRQYRIEERIGEGGMGVVYRAYDTQLRRNVALKFLPDFLDADPRAKQRFLTEARAAAALDHPNICTVHEVVDTPESRTFIAMAFYDGATLARVLEKGPLPWRRAVDYATQIARGLAAAHERGIVHRDVKPGNVVITADGAVKLLDFGVAYVPASTVSRPGITPGTILYMSPEQVTSQKVDHRTDLWSLGVVLYEMCTGTRPFDRSDAAASLHAVLHDRPRPPSSLRPGVPPAIDSLLDRLLEKDPDARPDDARQLVAELAQAGAGEERTIERPGPRMRAAAIVGLLLAIAVPSWIAVGGNRSSGAVDPAVADDPPPSLAVLAFESFSDEPGGRLFTDAVHDQVIAELMTIEAITVIARTSVLPYRDRRTALPEIAAELDVDYLLEGSVVRDGGLVRVNAALYDRAGRSMWSDSFEHEDTLVLRLQAEIARSVARSIDARLTPSEQQRFASKRSIDARAFTLYAEGRSYLDQGGPERDVGRDSAIVLLARSTELFERATREDSTWALPWADLAAARHWFASTLVNMPTAWDAGPGSKSPRVDSLYSASKDAAERAIRLDSTEAAAWAALGFVLQRWAWDWEGSEDAYREARRLSPNYFEWGSAWLYLSLGRDDEAIEAFEHALRRHPASRLLHAQYGNALACLGQHEEARPFLDRSALAPLGIGYVPATALLHAGQYAAAVTELESYVAAGEEPPQYMAFAYSKAGNREKALEVVKIREALGVRSLADDVAIGDRAALVRRLDSMVANRVESIVNLRCRPDYRDIVAVPDAKKILERLNLPILGVGDAGEWSVDLPAAQTSARSATTGSTRDARRAGGYVARSATAASPADAAT